MTTGEGGYCCLPKRASKSRSFALIPSNRVTRRILGVNGKRLIPGAFLPTNRFQAHGFIKAAPFP